MTRTTTRSLATLFVALTITATPVTAQSPAANPVCGPGILRENGTFDLARVGPQIAGDWTEQAYGVRVATGIQTTSLSIVHDALRGRIYMQGDGVQIPLTMVRGARRDSGWDFVNNRPIPGSELFAGRSAGGFSNLLAENDCEWDNAPQFSWEYRTPRGTSQGFITFLSPRTAVGVKWNSAMGARDQLMTR